jgi:adenylate kinase
VIIFFGPAGAGKSVQGQILELLKQMQTGSLISNESVNKIMGEAIKRSKNIDHLILDGFPRQLSQAEWLVESQEEHERSISLVIVLEVPESELLRRLQLRGRADDTPETVAKRMQIYRTEIYPILTYLTDKHIKIVHIDGTGTVGQVHDRIAAEIEATLTEPAEIVSED